jgi:hydrogenase maturation factor
MTASGFPVGKLPAEFLGALLSRLPKADPRVVVGPRVGEDAAVIDFGSTYLVAKTDPITFATDLIGWYAVNINANDIACMGARPRWFLATALLPEGIEPPAVEAIFNQLTEACAKIGVTLVGGHTEVTYGLDRPVIVGCMLGEVSPEGLVTSAGARPGDVIVVTKGIAIEGTAVLAREAADLLRQRGVPETVIDRARNFLFDPGISVVRDAAVAREAVPVTAFHDPTEGGLAAGLLEVGLASGVGFEVEAGKVPVLPECRLICDALGLDPLGLLASGSLLVTVPAQAAPDLLSALERAGIPAAVIGRVLPAEAGYRLLTPNGPKPWPRFERDEVARFYESRSA